jgi:hypothetical protein
MNGSISYGQYAVQVGLQNVQIFSGFPVLLVGGFPELAGNPEASNQDFWKTGEFRESYWNLPSL